MRNPARHLTDSGISFTMIITLKTTQTVKDGYDDGQDQLTEEEAKGKYFKIRYYVKSGSEKTYRKYSNIIKF